MKIKSAGNNAKYGAILNTKLSASARQEILFEKELDAIGKGLEKSIRPRAVRPDPVLHVGDDLALEPDHQHHRDKQDAERDEDLDDGDNHHGEPNPAREQGVSHQVTFSTRTSTTAHFMVDQARGALAHRWARR